MKKVCVIGHFAFGKNLLNGQTVKTKIVTEELEKRFTQKQVLKIDTHGGALSLLKAPFQVLKALLTCKNIVILPAHNGLRVFAPLLRFMRCFFKGRKLHYIVIGGWLPEFVSKRNALKKSLMKFDSIFVETSTMKKNLEKAGFLNIQVLLNCKDLTVLQESDLVYTVNPPLKVCTFSRVMREKGIEDAVNAVKAINEKEGKTVYTLDIYGQVDSAQTQWFESLQKKFPDFVKYRGAVSFDKSVEVLKEYFALLFPTHFYTEGIPGTIIDAYAAGVPVISAEWESFSDIIDRGVTGEGYPMHDFSRLVALLHEIEENPQEWNEKKKNCIQKAKEYLPSTALQKLAESLDDKAEHDRLGIKGNK